MRKRPSMEFDVSEGRSPFLQLNLRAKEKLLHLASSLPGIDPISSRTFSISLGQLTTRHAVQPLLDSIKDWLEEGNTSIYVMEAMADDDLSEFEAAFKAAKQSKKNGRAYCRCNGIFRERNCRTLYVGQSKKLATRLKEHLGYGGRSTYALQISEWAMPFRQSFEIHCAQYASSVKDDALQVLEDCLWDERRPLFGKRGAR